jgi:hypothetical protein
MGRQHRHQDETKQWQSHGTPHSALEMICYRRNGLATLTPAQIRSGNCYGKPSKTKENEKK